MLSKELNLMVLCSKLKIQEKEQKAINKLITGHIDWNLFFHLTLQHGVYPLVYRYLSTLAQPAVPGVIVSALRQANQENISKTLQMTAELVRVLRAMVQSGIRVVVMKGFPLAFQLYGDITLRPCGDLDILVWPEDIDNAKLVIEEQGYFLRPPISQMSSARRRKWMEANQHLKYFHPDREIDVELHWRLGFFGKEKLIHADSSLEKVKLAGQSICVLGKGELFLFLVLHGAGHHWLCLKWLYDVDRMIRRGDLSWGTIYQVADNLGVKVVLNQALILSRELLGTPVPEGVIEMATKDTKAQDLAVMALHFIADNDYHPKSLKVTASLFYLQKKYQFCLRSRWRERITYIAGCFLPSEEDLELISLSEKLDFMYYIMSPFTWFYRRVRNIAGRFNLW